MKIPLTELIERLHRAQGDAATAQLMEAAANRIAELEAKVEGYRLSSIEQWRRKKEWQGRCSKMYAQSATTADLVRWLLADHQRVEPHHADQCQLCREATAAIDGQPAQGERQP